MINNHYERTNQMKAKLLLISLLLSTSAFAATMSKADIQLQCKQVEKIYQKFSMYQTGLDYTPKDAPILNSREKAQATEDFVNQICHTESINSGKYAFRPNANDKNDPLLCTTNDILIAHSNCARLLVPSVSAPVQKCRTYDQMYNNAIDYATQAGVGAIANYPIDKRAAAYNKAMNWATKMSLEDFTLRTGDSGYNWLPKKMTFEQLQNAYANCVAKYNK